jgi:hypothetical protein
MRVLQIKSSRIAIALALFLAPALANSHDKQHFDLVCHGQMQEVRIQSAPTPSVPSTLRIRVDIQKRQFCIDDLCNSLTRADEKRIEYHCHADRTFCYQTWSTAGPFIVKDDFTVNRLTGEFQRSDAGSVGDRAPRDFNSKYSGICRPAPFSGLRQTVP